MDIHDQVLNAFQIEHKEQLDRIRSILGTLGDNTIPRDDPRWDEAFRLAHTLKGGAHVCDLRELEQLGHRMESLFSSVRDGGLEFGKEVADIVYLVLDAIEDWMAVLANNGVREEPVEALQAIERLLHDANSRSSNVQPAPAATPIPEQAPSLDELAGRPVIAGEADSVRVRIGDLDSVLHAADELFTISVDHDRIAQELAQLKGLVKGLIGECESIRTANVGPLRRLAADPEFARVARHVDFVVQQARRISKKESQIRTIQRSAAWTFNAYAESLHRSVQCTRMVAAENVFHGLGVMVRNLARDEAKQIKFSATGLESEADRRVLQSLKDPLMHILRNAVVHGIESPDQRLQKGKTAQGNVTLSLQTHGSVLELIVEDDGQGVDFQEVEREAMRRGLFAGTPKNEKTAPVHRQNGHYNDEPKPAVTGDLSGHIPESSAALTRLLFQPGFTTTAVVNELAGRGMGLSVVHTAVFRLQGTVDVQSKRGGGTAFSIRVPLSISAQRLLLVNACQQTFAIPVHGIDSLIRAKSSDIHSLEGHPVINADGTPAHVVHLGQFLGLDSGRPDRLGRIHCLVVLRAGDRRIALEVDEFVAEREALIKELDRPAAAATSFTGAVLLADGKVALVLSPSAFLNDVANSSMTTLDKSDSTASAQLRRENASRTILIVDDSFTTRTLEKSILEANGYGVRVAVDGLEALNCLRSEPIDLVIADVEMPRMDGLTMLKTLKADPRLSHVPVLLVTSLDHPEDEERGLSLGADAYIVKRKFDHQVLLSAINRFL